MLLLRLVAASEREAWRARRLVNEGLLLVHGGSRIGEGGRGKSISDCLLSLLGTPGPSPVVTEPWLPRFRTAENERRRNF